MVRRLFDLVVSGAALAVLGIPFAVVSMVIALTSRGPIFFRQQRIGRGGRPFWLYKFRTMQAGATGSQVTVTGDNRIYPVGRWLRRWKVDELPQFWNVFRGDMSVVGPTTGGRAIRASVRRERTPRFSSPSRGWPACRSWSTRTSLNYCRRRPTRKPCT